MSEDDFFQALNDCMWADIFELGIDIAVEDLLIGLEDLLKES